MSDSETLAASLISRRVRPLSLIACLICSLSLTRLRPIDSSLQLTCISCKSVLCSLELFPRLAVWHRGRGPLLKLFDDPNGLSLPKVDRRRYPAHAVKFPPLRPGHAESRRGILSTVAEGFGLGRLLFLSATILTIL